MFLLLYIRCCIVGLVKLGGICANHPLLQLKCDCIEGLLTRAP